MSSVLSRFRTTIISIGAFALGVAWEKNGRLFADVGDQTIVLPNSGDTLDLKEAGDQLLSVPASGPSDVSLITKHGFPSMDSLRSYPNFVVSYDRRNRVAHWVLERITAQQLATSSSSVKHSRKDAEFFEDKSFHSYFRASNADYKGSGYDRGHLAAAGNYRTVPEHIKQTFVLSNIAPQVGRGFNRDKWNELEKYTRARVRKAGEAWVCTGPLYLPAREPSTGKLYVKYEVIGKNNVAVPTHFFKALLYPGPDSGQYQLECFVMPNAEIPSAKTLNDFRLDPSVVERAAGILLFNGIPRNQIKVIT